MREYLSLKEIKEELERILNLEVLEIEVKILKGALRIFKKEKNWENTVHISLWKYRDKFYLSVDVGFFKNREIPKEKEEELKDLEKLLRKLYEEFCPSFEGQIKQTGYYGIKVREFNTSVCNIIGHIIALLCLIYKKYWN